jgi:hypothetical protein
MAPVRALLQGFLGGAAAAGCMMSMISRDVHAATAHLGDVIQHTRGLGAPQVSRRRLPRDLCACIEHAPERVSNEA